MKSSYCSCLGMVQRTAAGALAALLLAAAAAAASSERIAITSATWKAEKAELKVEGVSRHVDGVVLVRDAVTKKLLGSSAVRRDGKWVLKIRDPSVVPSRMRVEVEGACTECAVQPWTDPATAVAVQGESGSAR